jgi:hypothetical protein
MKVFDGILAFGKRILKIIFQPPGNGVRRQFGEEIDFRVSFDSEAPVRRGARGRGGKTAIQFRFSPRLRVNHVFLNSVRWNCDEVDLHLFHSAFR